MHDAEVSTFAQLEVPRPPGLDRVIGQIGSGTSPSPTKSSLRALVDELAHAPLPEDPHAVDTLRHVAQDALAQLPTDHPLAGAQVAHAGAALLVRLLVRLHRDLGDVTLTLTGMNPEKAAGDEELKDRG